VKAILFTCCIVAAAPFTADAADKIKVASFSTIDTEIVQQVGDDHVEVAALV
jgi:ABC-type Zn uptake system ZnuABC Zn-binding protein ZnuA